jgi:hypothetical protein
MTHISNEGTQRIPQEVLTLSWEVDDCKPLIGGAVQAEPQRVDAGGDQHLQGGPAYD